MISQLSTLFRYFYQRRSTLQKMSVNERYIQSIAEKFPHLSEIEWIITFDILEESPWENQDPPCRIVKLTSSEKKLLAAAHTGVKFKIEKLLNVPRYVDVALSRVMRSSHCKGETEFINLQLMVHLAIQSKSVSLTDYLLRLAKKHKIPYHHVLGPMSVFETLVRGSLDLFRLLYDIKPEYTSDKFYSRCDPLSCVLGRSCGNCPTLTPNEELEFVSFILENEKSDVNMPSAFGVSDRRTFGCVLGRAIRHCPLSVVVCIPEHGARVIQSGAIHAAALVNRCEAMDVLVEYGADVNEGLIQSMGEMGDIDGKSAFETPLHLVVRCGKKGALVWLLEHGADLRKGDRNGRTPLDLARELGKEDILGLVDDYIGWKVEASSEMFWSEYAEEEDWRKGVEVDYSHGGFDWEVWRQIDESVN